jgi:hypothetical protein
VGNEYFSFHAGYADEWTGEPRMTKPQSYNFE